MVEWFKPSLPQQFNCMVVRVHVVHPQHRNNNAHRIHSVCNSSTHFTSGICIRVLRISVWTERGECKLCRIQNTNWYLVSDAVSSFRRKKKWKKKYSHYFSLCFVIIFFLVFQACKSTSRDQSNNNNNKNREEIDASVTHYYWIFTLQSTRPIPILLRSNLCDVINFELGVSLERAFIAEWNWETHTADSIRNIIFFRPFWRDSLLSLKICFLRHMTASNTASRKIRTQFTFTWCKVLKYSLIQLYHFPNWSGFAPRSTRWHIVLKNSVRWTDSFVKMEKHRASSSGETANENSVDEMYAVLKFSEILWQTLICV